MRHITHFTRVRRGAKVRASRAVTTLTAVLVTMTFVVGGVNLVATPWAGATPVASTLALPSAGLSPAENAVPYLQATAISCPTGTLCASTGQYRDTNGQFSGFAAVGSLSGSAWSWSMMTIPIGSLSPVANSSVSVDPTAISCPSATSCLVTGDYYDVSGGSGGFVSVGLLSAGTWTWTSTTLPIAALNPASSDPVGVTPASISCASTTSCVITGNYHDVNNNNDGLVVIGTANGATWSWASSTLPLTGLTPTPRSFADVNVTAIACATPAHCVAIGDYGDSSSNYDGFVAVGTLGAGAWSWTLSTMPLGGLSPASNTSPLFYPLAISCPSVSECLVSGKYEDATTYYDGFIAAGSWNATTWTWSVSTLGTSAFSPAPNTLPNVIPTSVSCLSSTQCVLSGFYRDTNGNFEPFLGVGLATTNNWSWSNATLSTVGLTPASNSSPSFNSKSVSCSPAGNCVATGYYEDDLFHVDGYYTSLTRLFTASSPTISNVPTVATLGHSFAASVTTNGDGPLSLSSTSPGVCSVNGLVVTFTTPGTCSLTAAVGDGTNFTGAVGTAQSVAVSAASQSPLSISNKITSVALRATVTLSTKGGSGGGRVSFRLVASTCILKGNRLHVTSAHACRVVATKAATITYKAATSTAKIFYFGFHAQKTLIVKASSSLSRHTKKVTLSTTGGSGRGAIRYLVSGVTCTLKGAALSATRATTCVVSATKGSTGTYLPASSKRLSVRFT